MADNLFQTQYNLTKKSKLREFYESNKIWIYSTLFAFIIIIGSYSYYKNSKERKKILLSENYIEAKVHFNNGDKTKAVEILRSIIFSNRLFRIIIYFLFLSILSTGLFYE